QGIDARLKYIVSLQYSVLACTFLSVFSMNFLKIFTARAQGQGRKNSRSFPNGTAKVDIIFEPANFFGDFF
ncbi:MAG: hypothetical protein II874_10740, partial [Bacteroidales bacterium]|nr:hypothetical protein [Bacteroidales bacterium]